MRRLQTVMLHLEAVVNPIIPASMNMHTYEGDIKCDIMTFTTL